MARPPVVDLGEIEYGEFGPTIATLVDARENEILSLCRDLFDTALSDSLGRVALEIFLPSDSPMTLGEIESRSGLGRRAMMRRGRLRAMIGRMHEAGILVNAGSQERPRYALNGDDRRVRVLVRMYSSSVRVRKLSRI